MEPEQTPSLKVQEDDRQEVVNHVPEAYKAQVTPVKPMRRKRPLLIIAGVILLFVLIAAVYLLFIKKDSSAPAVNEPQNNTSTEPVEKPTTIQMLATGDWIAHDSVNAQAKSGDNYDYAQFLTAMKPFFADSDINFCNQATLAGGEEYGISGYPVFNAPTKWISDMKGFGCNLINTGTNHTNDKGQGPITAQAEEWDKQQGVLAVVGANRSAEEQKKVRYFEKDGVKFAFLSFVTYSNSPNPNPYSLNRFDSELYEPQMKEAREKADIVIVSMRWGTEYSPGINAAQETAAQKLANLGADIVLGHGPHVLEPVKRLKGKDNRETIVWYSLGNFLNTQVEIEALTGCVAQFDIDIATKKVTQNMCLPFYMHYEWTAEEKAKEELLARKNLQILPLFNADELMAKSQLRTTVTEQMDRIRKVVNTFTEIPIQNATDL
ncbi:MAG: CapA family protein [bacterium]|nr:CapA family protein [bacterium]